MLKFETIVAPVTPYLNSPVGIVRLSGPSSLTIALKICGSVLVPRVATYSIFSSQDSVEFDRGIVLYFKGPHSFTGEDVIEFQCHGGLGVIDLLIDTCLNFNSPNCLIRLASPGEFSKRAFLNSKINLIEAEAIADIINASTMETVKAINNSLSGRFGSLLDELSDLLLAVRAGLEAKIDFVEDNLGALEVDLLLANVRNVKDKLSNCLAFSRNGNTLQNIGKLVLLGSTNVGKSSLLNSFSLKDSSIVSKYRGTTRDVVREFINVDNTKIQVSDTAGIRETSNDVEKEGVRRTWLEVEDSSCLLFVCDISSKSIDDDLLFREEVLAKIKNQNKHLITVVNKIDKIKDKESIIKDSKFDNSCFFISAKTGEGLNELKQEISKIFSNHDLVNYSECLVVTKRVELNLKECFLNVDKALDNIFFKKFDLCAEDLKKAHFSIKEIIGEDVSDELLDKIFSTFCIGK
jgi:tRNA modification GTPase